MYRVTDTTRSGLVSCLTPTGFPWPTAYGRLLNGLEAWPLQGLPTVSLILRGLTQTNLQDLAGNAMTSTVVGVTMLAALTTCFEVLEPGTGTECVSPEVKVHLHGIKTLIRKECDPVSHEKLCVGDAMAMAAATMKLCGCQNYDTTFLQCTICGHTACIDCGKNPKHKYAPIPQPVLSSRKNFNEFAKLLKKTLPLEFSLTGFDHSNISEIVDGFYEEHKADIDTDTWNRIKNRISPALASKCKLQSVTNRKTGWEVTYDSPAARVTLIITRHTVEWSFFANGLKLPLGSQEGKYIRKFPILRMRPDINGNDITIGQWEFWLPHLTTVTATVTSRGPLVPSYLAQAGATAHLDEYVATSMEISIKDESKFLDKSLLSGVYLLNQDCGQAFNSLHIQDKTVGLSKRIFCYLNHEKASGNPKRHNFVLTDNIDKLKVGEYRRGVIARFPNKWRQHIWTIDRGTPIDIARDTASAERVKEVELSVEGQWIKVGFSINKSHTQTIVYNQLPGDITQFSDSCEHYWALFTSRAYLGPDVSSLWVKDHWLSVDQAIAARFIDHFGWTIEQGISNPAHCHSSDFWHVTNAGGPTNCPRCVPPTPKLLWELNSKDKQAPFEVPEEAADFERVYRNRPDGLIAQVRIDESNNMDFRIGMNPSALIHQATALLNSTPSTSEIETSWRLMTDVIQKVKPQLQPLTIQINAGQEKAQASNFKDNLKLRPEQERALFWAMDQERGKPFKEDEVVEASLPYVNHHLWGKASREVIVKGGVLAFEVGFGKTILTLGLVENGRQNDRKWADKMKARMKGALPIKATMIFMPSQLPEQWNSEIKKFLKAGKKVILLKTALNLKKYTFKDYEEADYILIGFNLCESAAYRKLVAEFSGMVEHDDKATPRAKDAWYKSATEAIQINFELMRDHPSQFSSMLDKIYEDNFAAAASTTAPVPSKRTRGQAYQNLKAQQGSNKGKKRKRGAEGGEGGEIDARTDALGVSKLKEATGNEPWRVVMPILEMFMCARVVVDEYSYTDSNTPLKSMISFMITRAEKRWLLSGTPPLSGFADVKKMAELLGINLGVDDFSLNKAKFTEMTCECPLNA